jgi:peptide/nickel transport system ATP-binding protein
MALLAVEALEVAIGSSAQRRLLVSGVDLRVDEGEVVAIVGESGSGKSLLARAIVGLLPPGLSAKGRISLSGMDLLAMTNRERRRVRRNRLGLVMQDPFTTLHPLMKCGAQICEGAAAAGLGRRARLQYAAARLADVGIADAGVADQYPFQLSGGMRQRVALAAALGNAPDLLIADEFSTALDVTTQKEIWLLMRRLQRAAGMALVIITHDLRMAFAMCDRVYVMYGGRVVETGPASDIDSTPAHPYTLALLLAEPELNGGGVEVTPGRVPPAAEVADVCAFAARCQWVEGRCRSGRPPLTPISNVQATACVRAAELAPLLSRHREGSLDASPKASRAMARGAALLEVDDLRKVFGGGGGRADRAKGKVALDGVGLIVREHESVGIVGESGSGKTTLARCIVGLETPSAGRIVLAGIDATRRSKLDSKARVALQRTVQYVFQDPYSSLNPTKTVAATLGEAVRLRDPSRARVEKRVGELLELVGLAPRTGSCKPASLSGGERQRVAIARALALEPRLLVCDEPLSALDVSVQAQVLALLADLKEATGISYLFITHDLAVVRQVADRLYVMRCGRVVEEGPAEATLKAPIHAYTRALLAAVPGMWDRDSGAPSPSVGSIELAGRTHC